MPSYRRLAHVRINEMVCLKAEKLDGLCDIRWRFFDPWYVTLGGVRREGGGVRVGRAVAVDDNRERQKAVACDLYPSV